MTDYYQSLKVKLIELEQEHKELNEVIDDPKSIIEFSQFTLQKLKKRKLILKDQINRVKTLLYPDIIA